MTETPLVKKVRSVLRCSLLCYDIVFNVYCAHHGYCMWPWYINLCINVLSSLWTSGRLSAAKASARWNPVNKQKESLVGLQPYGCSYPSLSPPFPISFHTVNTNATTTKTFLHFALKCLPKMNQRFWNTIEVGVKTFEHTSRHCII